MGMHLLSVSVVQGEAVVVGLVPNTSVCTPFGVVAGGGGVGGPGEEREAVDDVFDADDGEGVPLSSCSPSPCPPSSSSSSSSSS